MVEFRPARNSQVKDSFEANNKCYPQYARGYAAPSELRGG